MKSREIAFVSAKSRGISPDLKLVKDYLEKNIKYASFSYYLNAENSNNEMVKKGAKFSKKEFCRDLKDAICIDGSLPTKLTKNAKEGAKVLISVPYDYQFKAVNECNKGKNTFKSFTHVIAGSPFGEEIFKEYYKIPKKAVIERVCTPFAWDLNQEAKQQEMREKFLQHFPAMKGKKILSILLTGHLEKGEKNPFEKFDWRSFLKTVGDEWFVFVNNWDLLENTVILNSKYTSCFGYVNKMMDARDLMYFSDCLVTNSGMYASYFSSKNKPVYCLSYKNNEFEKYMKKRYPSLFVKNISEKTDKIMEDKLSDEQKAFCTYFSYGTETNPSDKILEILNK